MREWRSQGMRAAVAVTTGILVAGTALYGGIWLSSALYHSADLWDWPELRRVLLLVPILALLGLMVGVIGGAISRTALAAKIAVSLILLAGAVSFAAGWGHSGWFSALAIFMVLAAGVYMGGILIARRWPDESIASGMPLDETDD